MAEQFTRNKPGYPFVFHGVKVDTSPDRIPVDKYASALNVRGYSKNSIRTRPGQALRFATGSQPITDIRAFSDLSTDNTPRILARDAQGRIYLDTGALEYTMIGGSTNLGVSMIPFRSNESTSPQMYIGSATDYVKIPSPLSGGTVAKAGIAEPQSPPGAVVSPPITSFLGDPNNNAGTAGAGSTGLRTNDTVVGTPFLWPGPIGTQLWSVQTGAGVQYQRFQNITFAGANPGLVQDVFQQFSQTLAISGIIYFVGTVGRCVVVPSGLGTAPGNEGTSIYADTVLTGLRRGTLIKIGTEVCMVLSVTAGPDGSVSIETSTTAHHTTADMITSVPSISVMMLSPTTPSGAITAGKRSYQVTTGIGTMTTAGFGGLLVNQAFQPDDYISFAVNIDNLLNLNEIKILLDVGDGSFTQNFYYYTIRPSDIATGVGNVLTQLGATQEVIQRAIIDEENAAAANNQGKTTSSAQTSPGSAQWSQILIPVSSFTRVGDDQTLTLQQIVKVQFLYNASGTINVQHGTTDFYMAGGSQPDVGDIGAPYLYRVRPRSAQSGALGNPSPATRYGTNPRRQSVNVSLPSAAYDPQIDTWDVFRYGGSITSWRYVGSTSAFNSVFVDNFSDDAVNAGDVLDFDNFEPWPTVDRPNTGTAVQVCGVLVILNSTDTDIIGYLPGTLIQIGTINVYTLRNRPILLSFGTYQVELEENAGAGINLPFTIQEPALANQHLPYLFGPDASGTVFGVGDNFRPGTLNFSKNYAPDSVPDSYNIEITPPSEPLMGGEILDGLAFVASTERWWALYPQPQNPLQRFNVVQAPLTRGLAGPFGHCNDGVSIYWWAKDGIYSSTEGSLTDADLYTLFPHEGVGGRSIIRNGVTYLPPAYGRAGTFRLTYSNGYLYATYSPSPLVYATLVYNVATKAWLLDAYSPLVSTMYHIEQQAGTLNITSTNAYDRLLMGNVAGQVSAQSDFSNDIGGPISCVLATFEDMGGDARAGEQWGDLFLDAAPAAQGFPVQVGATSQGNVVGLTVTLAVSASRVMQPVSIGGGVLANFLGMQLTWTDDFTIQNAPTTLFLWQPSYLPKPETIADRISDWDDAGVEGAKWIQGFILHADTFAAVKGLSIQDADTLLTHTFTPIVLHNGESEIAYSFDTPFIAHMVRIVPTDQLPWRLWEARWVVQETPEFAETWQTQASTHGMLGFMHVRQISITYSATAPVTFTITSFDGTSPAPIVLPATGGAVQKLVFQPTFNKGQLYFYKASSAVPFQIYVDKCEVLVGAWSRQDAYVSKPLIGETGGDRAEI